jgi:hypothetical protein
MRPRVHALIHDDPRLRSGPSLGNGLGREAGSPSASTDARTLAEAAIVIATQSGVLLALAVTAFLLAPAHRRAER